MSESSLMMVIHSAIIVVILYLIMFYGLKQSQNRAIDRSLLLGAIVLIYMILYGHSAPSLANMNPNIYA